jgi:Zn-dependent protease with chaperone function
MSFLLMVFLVLVCLPESYPAPLWGRAGSEGSVAGSALLTLLGIGLVGLHAFVVSRRVSRPLARDPSLRDTLVARYERWRFAHRVGLFAMYGLVLIALGWGWSVRQFWRWDGQPLPGTELLILAPFLTAQVLSWLFFYDADRAAYRAAHAHCTPPDGELDGLDAEPFGPAWLGRRPADALRRRAPARKEEDPPFGGRWAYVAFQARQKLALVFIPILLLIVQKEAFRFVPQGWRESWQSAVNVAGLVTLLAVFTAMPWIVRLVLGLKPLPAGAMRDRLLATANRLGFRCSDILLWNTRSGMANAMVVGILPWLRYVVFTDRLVNEFPEDEAEAVFGHEIGHIRHQHMLYYLGFLTLSVTALGVVAHHYVLEWLYQGVGAAAGSLLSEEPATLVAHLFHPEGELVLFPVVGMLLAYIFVVFGFLSRRCERQADIFGCRAVSCAERGCAGHEAETVLPARGRGLCPTGIRTFIRALEKVAQVNGISRDRPGFLQSWQHSTIARRVEFLESMLSDASVEPAFQRRVGLVKWALFVALAVALTFLVSRHGWGL